MNPEVTCRIIAEVAELAEVTPEQISEETQLADLGLDSLQALQLLVVLERTFEITLDEQDIQQFYSIKSITGLVSARLASPAVA